MPYIGTQPKDVRSFGKVQFDFTATQGQTAFTGADDDGKTLGFTEGQIQVYVNGILMDASDYTTSNTNTVTLVSAANLNDIITVVALQTDIPNSDYVPISGGTFTGNISGTTADFSGNVGVGTSSPQATLHVSDIGSTGPALLIAGGSGTEGDVVVPHNEQLQVGHWNNTTSTFTERMKIDTAGRVTMPYQPSFSAYLTTTASVSGTVVFNNTTYNNGNHFNTSTGKFTAPVAGVYLFTVIVTSAGTQGATHMFLAVNGSRTRDMFEGNSWITNTEIHASAHLQLAANDVVDFNTGTTWSVQGNSNNNYYSSFMGHLLG